MPGTTMLRRLPVVLATLLLTLAVAGTAPARAAAQNSQVYVVNGLPGQPVDVYTNGAKTLSDLQPSTVSQPVSLPAGTYDVVLTKPGQPVSQPLVQLGGAQLPPDANISLVAHLSPDNKQVLTSYPNLTGAIPTGQGRVAVRHDADAPGVDVRADGQTVISNLTNPQQVVVNRAPGTTSVDVVLTGTGTVVAGPQNLTVAANGTTILYIVGSANAKTLGLIAQTVNG